MIEVNGIDQPYSAYGKYYMRSADEDRVLSPTASKQIMIKKSAEDVIAIIDSPRQDLTFNKLKIAYVTSNLTVD